MELNKGFLKISLDELLEFTKKADSLLKNVEWKSDKKTFSNKPESELDSVHSLVLGGKTVNLSYYTAALEVSNSGYAMSDAINKVSLAFRKAIMISEKVCSYYEKASNMDIIKNERNQGTNRQLEFRKKNNTSSAIYAFVTASYMIYELSQYRTSEVESINLSFSGIPELDLANVPKLRKCMTFYYIAYLTKSGEVRNDLDFVKMSLIYFQAIVDEVLLKLDSLEYKDIFTSKSYKLEDSEFIIDGFNLNNLSKVSSVKFNRVKWEEIVGNTESKHSAKRSIMSLMCYDPVTKSNPMKDLGAFTMTKLTDGPPGTGKSLEISAIGTELSDRCADLGIPFLFHPFPDDIISSFQGDSAKNMIEWMKPFSDHSRIVFGPIDEAENNLEDRSNPGVSEGVKGVVNIFLKGTEGATAINYGNCLINMYTNLPENIDKAVLSRVQARAYMAGASTVEDFMDQDYIGIIKPFNSLIPGFVDLKSPSSYDYMTNQNVADKLNSMYRKKTETDLDFLSEKVEEFTKKFGVDTPEFFANLDLVMHEKFIYTSRDKRNIQSAVKSRIFDFDFDDSWLESPDVFFRKDYDTKKNMIVDLMKSSLSGKKFSDIFLEESIAYFNNLARISDKEFERKVKQALETERVMDEVRKRKL